MCMVIDLDPLQFFRHDFGYKKESEFMARGRRKKDDIVSLIPVLAGLIILVKILSSKQATNGLISIIVTGFFVFVAISGLLWFLRTKKKTKLRQALLLAGTANPMQLTPEQYEQFCATLLENNGWSTRLTKKSGDFGADIIAEKNGERLVIQCKQWSKSVGIQAVQEAHTAISHYRATRALVVTTTGYTPAAKNIAKSAGVRLLSHTDLVNM